MYSLLNLSDLDGICYLSIEEVGLKYRNRTKFNLKYPPKYPFRGPLELKGFFSDNTRMTVASTSL